MSERGNYSEWVPYEIWTSNNARRWAEGFKRELRSRGLHYDPTSLQVVSCGQQWTGCLTKYSNFFTKYLGVTRPVQVRPELSPEAGFPLEAVFREAIAVDRNVGLFLFETSWVFAGMHPRQVSGLTVACQESGMYNQVDTDGPEAFTQANGNNAMSFSSGKAPVHTCLGQQALTPWH